MVVPWGAGTCAHSDHDCCWVQRAILWPRISGCPELWTPGSFRLTWLVCPPHVAGVSRWLRWCDWPTRLLPTPGSIQAAPGLHASLHRHAPGADCRNLPQGSVLTGGVPMMRRPGGQTHSWATPSFCGSTEAEVDPEVDPGIWPFLLNGEMILVSTE